MNRRRLMIPLLASLAGVSCAEPEGLDVTVAVGDFAGLSFLRIVLAVDGGFVQGSGTRERVTYGTQYLDGEEVPSMVVEIPRPAKSETFRVTTGNKTMLTFRGHAMVFDDNKLVAEGREQIPLAQGGHAQLKIGVTEYKGTIVSPKLRSTDLQTATPDVVIKGAPALAPIKALAVCDFDNDGHDDVAVGMPGAAPPNNLGPAGAVYIAFGDGTSPAFELGTGKEFHFFSNQSEARLGTAVACADLDGDGFADLVVGAPGFKNADSVNAGKVYVVFGRQDLAETSIDLSMATKQPDVQWTTATAQAGLGSVLFALRREDGEPGKILAAAPGASLVHLFSTFTRATTPIDADKPDHPTFTGVKAAALGAGRFKSKTGPHDIVLGDPEFRPANTMGNTGVVYVFAAVPATTAKAYTVNEASVAMTGGDKSQFGAAVLALRTTGLGQDLFVGAPAAGPEDVGQVFVYEYNDDFFVFRERGYSMSAKNVLSGTVASGQFGRALAGTVSGMPPSETRRLLVGAPGVKRGNRTTAGAAYMLGSVATREFPVLDEMFGAASGDLLGSLVAGGRIDADGIGDLVTVAEAAMGPTARSSVVYVKLGQ